MSEHDINLVTSKAGSTVVENLKVSLATPAASLTPATFTAMIGIAKGEALQIAQPVQDAMAKLANIASSNSSANVSAAAALSSLTSFQSSLGFGGSPNQAAFGSFLNQAHSHIQDSVEVRKATDFMANMSYGDLGAGVKDLGSSADRGMSNALGSLPSAGDLVAATGTMYNSGDIKNFGSSLGMVKSLMENKLANATGVMRRLANAGVPVKDLDNPIYKDKIDQVMNGITDPGAMSVVADQYDVAPEVASGVTSGNSTTDSIMAELQDIVTRLNAFADSMRGEWISGFEAVTSNAELNAYRDSFIASQDNKDYQAAVQQANSISTNKIKPLPNDEFKLSLVNFRNNDVETAINDANAAVQEYTNKGKALRAMFNSQEGLVTDATMSAKAVSSNTLSDNIAIGTSVPSTAMGASLSPGQSLPAGAGGIQSLKDLGDPSKLNPGAAAGVTGGASGVAEQLFNMGASTLKSAASAPSLFGQLQSVSTPLSAASFPSLGGLIKDHQSMIDSMTGSGSGPLGLPNMTDFTEHLAGGPSITSFMQNVDSDPSAAISSLNASVTKSSGLFATAGVDLTTPPPNTLGTAMAFAQNLKKFGADISGSGVGDILHNMANTASAYGEGIKASLAEGKNDKLLADNGIPPIATTPPPPAGSEQSTNYPITVSQTAHNDGSDSSYEVTAVASSASSVAYKVQGISAAPEGSSYHEEGTYSYVRKRVVDLRSYITDTDPDSMALKADLTAVVTTLDAVNAQMKSQLSGGSPKALG